MLTSTETGLVRKDSIEELCGHRARAMELYAMAIDNLRAAMKAHSRACVGASHITTQPITKALQYPDYQSPDGFARTVQETIDRDMWNGFIINTPLGGLMDAEEKKKFHESLKGPPPECTPDTVFATLSNLAGQANTIFRRGLVNAFRTLSRDYRSHDGFKIGDRVIITGLLTGSGLHRYVSHYRDDTLADVDRCFHVLDGKPAPDYQSGILAAIRTALAQRDGTTEASSDYIHAKWFGNGNAHLRFTRLDLVQRANKLIADHYGESLGMGADAAQRKT
jgi:hypothetical protein